MRAHELQRLVSRRAVVFGGVQLFATTALVSRLYYLQFVRGDEFKTLAEGNRVKLQLIIPPRGVIADRYGVLLAGNHVNYRLMLEADNRKIARMRAGIDSIDDAFRAGGAAASRANSGAQSGHSHPGARAFNVGGSGAHSIQCADAFGGVYRRRPVA
jgi:hypothetical protein